MRNLMFAGALVLAGTAGAHAADLIVDPAPTPVDTSFTNSIYVQLLGGFVQDLDVTYFTNGVDSGPAETEVGYAIAGTLGVVVMDGLSLEADVLHSSREYSFASDDIYTTTSLMGNVKYTVDINDMFSVYGAVGLGYVWGNETWNNGNSSDDYGSFGYQLIAGVSAKFTDNISGVLEYRFQDTFDKSNYTSGPEDWGLSIPVSTVLAGVKLDF